MTSQNFTPKRERVTEFGYLPPGNGFNFKIMRFNVQNRSLWPKIDSPMLGGGRTCICHDTGMCHYFEYFLGVAPGFLGTFFGYSWIFEYHFLIKFDFFQNNPDFGVLIFDISINDWFWNVARRAYVSMILQFSLLLYYACAKSSILSITAISLSSYVCSDCLILTSFYHCG